MNGRCSLSHVIGIAENGMFFSTKSTFRHHLRIDLVANNFFKTVDTNLEHSVCLMTVILNYIAIVYFKFHLQLFHGFKLSLN